MIDHRLNFKSHLEYAAATAAISRMMANTCGPKQHSRRLIATVVTSTILYAAPIWALIPDLAPWLQRRHGQLDFYTTQIITGHGCFKAYHHRFKHEDDPYCDYCGSDFTEDAEHAFSVCPLFSAERAALEAAMNRSLTPDNLVGCMLETPSKWNAAAEMAATVMRELRHRKQTRRTKGDR
nr:uncharacterized protein LOC121501883 [Drosophila kikkawai]